MNPVLIVALLGLFLMTIAWLRPAAPLPKVRGWVLRTSLLNVAQIAVVYLGGVTWDRWMPDLAPWSAESWGTVPAVALGYVLTTFVFYWWHRARHASPFLWRWLHQIHHSAARIEVITSFYKHPLEILINGVLTSFVMYAALGLSPATASIVVTITGVAELLYHSNLLTPHWVGYLFQRPESHRRHHEIDHHRGNYSDLPIWDMLFGTFDNPHECPRECGFGDERERQLPRMLLGREPR